MSSATVESETRRSGHKCLRIALKFCFAAFCLVIFYVLLSAPLMLYAAHHPLSSSSHLVEDYLQPLLSVDELLTPDLTATGSEYQEPFHSQALYWYYGLWGSSVEQGYTSLRMKRWVQSFTESMEEEAPFLGTDGPDSPIP